MKMLFVGIKCDAKFCGYNDPNITVDQYPEFLNKPCPNCKGNLLTEADYKNVLTLQKLANNPIIRFLESVSNFFGVKEKKANIEMDGSGKMKVHIED